MITKPTKPIANIPKADILEIVLNSCLEGFLRTCHTLLHCPRKDFIFCMRL